MKTICFVVPKFPSLSETFVTNQIVQAKIKGYKVFVLTHHLGKFENSSQQDLLVKHNVLKDIIVIDYKIPKSKLKRFLVGLLPTFRYLKYWIKTPKVSIRHRFINLPYLLKFYGKLRDVNVFHIQFAISGIGIAEMKENGLLKGKVITTFHGHDAHFINLNEQNLLQQRYKIMFDICNYVTVNTPYLAQKVLAIGCKEEKLRIIPMGVDVTYFKRTNSIKKTIQNELKLISIGRLIKLKGFEFAIDAVKILVDKGVNVKYTIVGEGLLFDTLQHKIETLNLQKQVILIGNKNQDEIKKLLDSNHLFLMSSVTNPMGKSESQGVVTAEAQAMGLPVIAFNSGGVKFTLQDDKTGVLVAEKDVETYANAIIELFENPKRYDRMSEAAREFASLEFSIALMTERFMALYA